MYLQLISYSYICDQACENRSYLHKLHLFILWYISHVLHGYSIYVLLNSLEISVYREVITISTLEIRSNFMCRYVRLVFSGPVIFNV